MHVSILPVSMSVHHLSGVCRSQRRASDSLGLGCGVLEIGPCPWWEYPVLLTVEPPSSLHFVICLFVCLDNFYLYFWPAFL